MSTLLKIMLLMGVGYGIIGCSGDKDSKSDILGCTDPQAINYMPDATVDDGSCEYDAGIPVYGCTDPLATNYNPDATSDDGTCQYAGNNPNWSINASEFQYNGALTSTIEMAGVPIGSESDMLAGFSGNEIRGVTQGIYFSSTGKYLFMLTLYSDEITGEMISFKYYDESEDQILILQDEIAFTSNMIMGSPLDPVVLNVIPSVSEYFSFIQSSQQGFYFIQFAEINGLTLTPDDQIGVFYETKCIGSAIWAGEYTVVPAMGDDGTAFTAGYITAGEIPQFKIYDDSEMRYFNATPTGNIVPGLEWSYNAIINIEFLNADTE